MKIDVNQLIDLTKADGGNFGVDSLEEAYSFCKKIALGHYENFPVGSILIPKRLRKHFFSIYAFSRLADDLGDELSMVSKNLALEGLDSLNSMVRHFNIADTKKKNPIIYAIVDTMVVKNIPPEPFEKLITAFKQDVMFVRPKTMNDNYNYCKYSANPVGELVLRLFDNYNDQTAKYSDFICTGLQLVNFWQDISIDKTKNRIYVPINIQNKYGIEDNNFYEAELTKLDKMIEDLCEHTEQLFAEGKNLIPLVKSRRLRIELAMILEGGKRILQKTRKLKSKLLSLRPKLGKSDILIIFLRVFVRHRII